ncbi:unnamed protein product [Penicillium nalgiovense]|uniref:Uncharacterized protein n=1 Tax=Penicillium nalgiovense TaxID=60175 RepID=A0A1V6X550_PENNA|nr:hypothetical protein PENNAL_c0121G02698 [Penicillium nalgiovense]CAG7938001.1 unnamed protein product [Penicillium nalgiovense]CAG7938867.1 unnamed protein product [Penicillium nalgiovense]CAG7940637.1 unnamed protein product [Penicillium nalgiovense]CAG7940722.1 unnamed protein product [Penicillium nalgiovense]
MPTTEELKQTAFNAEKDLNSYQAKQGLGKKSDSTLESGVNEMVENKFDQPAGLKYGPGSTASGSDHRVIPEDEGGTRDDRNRLPKAGQFKGTGGPEEDVKIQAENRGGDQEIPDLQGLKRHGVAQ